MVHEEDIICPILQMKSVYKVIYQPTAGDFESPLLKCKRQTLLIPDAWKRQTSVNKKFGE